MFVFSSVQMVGEEVKYVRKGKGATQQKNKCYTSKVFSKNHFKILFGVWRWFLQFFKLFNLCMLLNHFQVLLLSKVPVEIFQACFFSKICK